MQEQVVRALRDRCCHMHSDGRRRHIPPLQRRLVLEGCNFLLIPFPAKDRLHIGVGEVLPTRYRSDCVGIDGTDFHRVRSPATVACRTGFTPNALKQILSADYRSSSGADTVRASRFAK